MTSEHSDSSEDKQDTKDKKIIKITKQDANSDDDDFDIYVLMLCGNEDEVIIYDQDDTMIYPYWNQASSPASNHD